MTGGETTSPRSLGEGRRASTKDARETPATTNRKDDLCVSLANLGENYVDQDNLTEGLPLLVEALKLRHRAECRPSRRSATGSGSRRSLRAWWERLQRHSGDSQSALRTYEQAHAAARAVLGHAESGRQVLRADCSARPAVAQSRALSKTSGNTGSIAGLCSDKPSIGRGRSWTREAGSTAAASHLSEALWDREPLLRGRRTSAGSNPFE